jgi:hypothetical protein
MRRRRAPYVISGLIRGPAVGEPLQLRIGLGLLDQHFMGNRSQEAELAAAFLDEKNCPGSRGLTEDNKAKLE